MDKEKKVKQNKNLVLRVRMTDEEYARLERVSEIMGTTKSEAVRRLLNKTMEDVKSILE